MSALSRARWIRILIERIQSLYSTAAIGFAVTTDRFVFTPELYQIGIKAGDQPTGNWTRNRQTDEPTIRFGARCPTLRAKTGRRSTPEDNHTNQDEGRRKQHTRQGASDECADGDETARIRHRHQNLPRPFPSHQPTAAKVQTGIGCRTLCAKTISRRATGRATDEPTDRQTAPEKSTPPLLLH